MSTRSIPQRRSSPSLWTMVLLLSTAIAGVGKAALAAPTLEELLSGLDKHLATFHAQSSYRFEFTISSTVYGGKYSYGFHTLEVTDIRRGTDMSTFIRYPKGSQYSAPNNPERSDRNVLVDGIAADLSLSTIGNRTGGLMQISPRIFTQHFQFHEYTDYQHINIYKDLPRPSGVQPYEPTQPFLPETIRRAPSKYQVRDQPEEVDGVPCWVVEAPGEDVIWFDSEGRVRKRRLYWGPDEPRSIETLLSDYTEFAPNLKLPKTISVAHYANPRLEEEKWWDKKTHDLIVMLRKAEFNKAVDADFRLDPPIGTTVNDYVRRVNYRVPRPGEKPFEEAIDSAMLDMPARRLGLIAINAAIIAILVAILLWRYVRKTPQAMHGSQS